MDSDSRIISKKNVGYVHLSINNRSIATKSTLEKAGGR